MLVFVLSLYINKIRRVLLSFYEVLRIFFGFCIIVLRWFGGWIEG